MESGRLPDGDIKALVESIRGSSAGKEVAELAEADLKAGFKEEKVRLYLAPGTGAAKARAMSDAIHKDMSLFLLKKVADKDEYVVRLVTEQMEGGMNDTDIAKALSKTSTVNAMEQLFSQMKSDVSHSKKEEKPEESVEENKTPQGQENAAQAVPGYTPEDIAKAIEPFLARLMDGKLNIEIDRLEKKVDELNRDLASSAGVIKKKEDEIARLREEMLSMAEHGRTDAAGTKAAAEKEIKTGQRGDGMAGQPEAGHGAQMGEKPGPQPQAKTQMQVGRKPGETYQTMLPTPDGGRVPVQIEYAAPRRPKGMLAMANRLFKGTPSQKALINMLIESRLKPDQLKEIKRAKDSRFTDEELKDLIESGLPAEEMAGIIDVLISDR